MEIALQHSLAHPRGPSLRIRNVRGNDQLAATSKLLTQSTSTFLLAIFQALRGMSSERKLDNVIC